MAQSTPSSLLKRRADPQRVAEEQLKARAVAAEREQEGDDDEDEEDDGMYEGERLRRGWERKISSTTGDVYYYCEVRLRILPKATTIALHFS